VCDVRVIERREDFSFTLKPGEPVGIGSERPGKDFDRDLAFQPGVGRSKDLSHAAFADLARDFVDAEASAENAGQNG